VTRRLTARFAEAWKKNHPEGEIVRRDLSTTLFPPITDDWGATHLDGSELTAAQRSYLSTSDELIEELQAAQTVVIGAPMYNFSILLHSSLDRSGCATGEDLWLRPNGRRAFWETSKSSSLPPRG